MLGSPGGQRVAHSGASVLLLRWEEDLSVADDLAALQKLFRERYNYATDSWTIPACADSTAKLAVRLAQHVEYGRPDNLRIVYYVGYSYVDMERQLYWAW